MRTRTPDARLVAAGQTVLGVNALRILARLWEARAARQTVTLPELARMLGIRRNGVHHHLTRLRKLGLVTWEYGLVRTLVATCAFAPDIVKGRVM